MTAVRQYLEAWDLRPLPLVAAAAAAMLYGLGVYRLAGRGRRWQRRRSLAFGSGLALGLLVVVGPIGAWDDTFFWTHMVQHVTLMMIVPPLLLLGSPVLLALQTSSRETRRRRLLPVLRGRAVRTLTDPVVSWLIFAFVLVGTHLTPFYGYAVTHPVVHDLVEHPLYLAAGLIYFYPLVGGNAMPHGPSPLVKVVSLALMMAPESMTGFFIYADRQLLTPASALEERPFGPGPLADQQLGGGLMWSSGMIIGAFWLTMGVLAWLQADARATARLDRAIAAEQAQAVRT
ncbi:MAG TPA: cytochrome c oxidase assembly protein [Kineosporiaceae bacterium]|nr:cytochrome c oxidase assembly protein [Kineosporiaceae bacterium]